MARKVVVVDDEKPIADILEFNLKKEGYDVYCAYDGNDAVDLIYEEEPDIVLLDIMLPGRDGMEVCREVRKKFEMPIIMLTAKDSEIDKVLGLELGADDYVTKPFSTRELIARVKANLRRHYSQPAQEVSGTTNEITIKDIVIYPDAYSIKKRGEDIELTHREFELFHYLSKHMGQVMTREHLLQTVWGYDYFGDVRTVDVTIRRLREKIEDDPSHPEYIVTRRGVGYFLQQHDQGLATMKWLKQLQSLHTKLVIVYVLLIIIGMQIIGLYFTNSLEKELTNNFMKNIKQYATQLEVNIERIYRDDPSNAQKEVQSLLNEYANRQEIEEIRFIDKDQIIMATAKISSHNMINQKVNDNSVQKALSLGESNSHNVLKDYGSGKERIWIYNLPVKNGNETIGNIYR